MLEILVQAGWYLYYFDKIIKTLRI